MCKLSDSRPSTIKRIFSNFSAFINSSLTFQVLNLTFCSFSLNLIPRSFPFFGFLSHLIFFPTSTRCGRDLPPFLMITSLLLRSDAHTLNEFTCGVLFKCFCMCARVWKKIKGKKWTFFNEKSHFHFVNGKFFLSFLCCVLKFFSRSV